MRRRKIKREPKVFKVDEHFQFRCEFIDCRDGFSHVATLLRNGLEIGRNRQHYINRTWESYEFQSVMRGAVDSARRILTKQEVENLHKWVEEYRESGTFDALQMVCKIGEILGTNEAEKNDWKKRMIKAQVGEAVDFPEDWNELPEEEKKRRLDGALEVLK